MKPRKSIASEKREEIKIDCYIRLEFSLIILFRHAYFGRFGLKVDY